MHRFNTALVLSLVLLFAMVIASAQPSLELTLPAFADGDSVPDEEDACPDVNGTSTKDRQGCPDGDGDGWSDGDENWTRTDGADAFPGRADAWSDLDGDGFTDQPNLNITDDCPTQAGTSTKILTGCSDMDYDLVPDIYDDDADGDGIRNEQERAASSGLRLFDPFDANSVPADVDADTIPDVIDDDNDNDGWPDEVEMVRGSDHLDKEETPFNMFGNVSTGAFYHGGLTFTQEYDPDAMEISVSWILDILTGELVIPILLIPIYVYMFVKRRRRFMALETMIEGESDLNRLHELELQVNELVRNKSIRVYHGLVLRNTIETREVSLGMKPKGRAKRTDHAALILDGGADSEE
uniref:Thrombospondin type 3 repeat-containing protein n=1 Tax=uncultured marine group II/III euryarchaeote KM3_178_D06 TaxID=1457940 RepID=A0A075GTC1_9EURY|nr:hypothetical protein [uncultured marine group II/III euryarchaeote KM3_178_D06]